MCDSVCWYVGLTASNDLKGSTTSLKCAQWGLRGKIYTLHANDTFLMQIGLVGALGEWGDGSIDFWPQSGLCSLQ